MTDRTMVSIQQHLRLIDLIHLEEAMSLVVWTNTKGNLEAVQTHMMTSCLLIPMNMNPR